VASQAPAGAQPEGAATPPAQPARKRRAIGLADRARIEAQGADRVDAVIEDRGEFPNPLPGANVLKRFRRLEGRERAGILSGTEAAQLKAIRANISAAMGPHWIEMVATDSPLMELRRRHPDRHPSRRGATGNERRQAG
jgi:hypothetical protein